MLGIWEYFWDLVDWAGAAPANICRVTAMVSSVTTRTAAASPLTIKTGRV